MDYTEGGLTVRLFLGRFYGNWKLQRIPKFGLLTYSKVLRFGYTYYFAIFLRLILKKNKKKLRNFLIIKRKRQMSFLYVRTSIPLKGFSHPACFYSRSRLTFDDLNNEEGLYSYKSLNHLLF